MSKQTRCSNSFWTHLLRVGVHQGLLNQRALSLWQKKDKNSSRNSKHSFNQTKTNKFTNSRQDLSAKKSWMAVPIFQKFKSASVLNSKSSFYLSHSNQTKNLYKKWTRLVSKRDKWIRRFWKDRHSKFKWTQSRSSRSLNPSTSRLTREVN